MQKNMDKITFESRTEIDEIIVALEKSPDKNKENVKKLINLLDVMYMEW